MLKLEGYVLSWICGGGQRNLGDAACGALQPVKSGKRKKHMHLGLGTVIVLYILEKLNEIPFK